MERVFEEIDYQGRRLAKLDLRPQEVDAALLEYDKVLAPALRRLPPTERANFEWVQEQLHFCTVLILNQAFYHVRETESRTFYELARREMAARGLDDFLQGAVETLANYTRAGAVQIYLRDPDGDSWQLRASIPHLSKAQPRPAITRSAGLCTDHATPLDITWPERFRTIWNVPLIANGRVDGVMQFGFDTDYPWFPRERELLQAAAERCHFSVERARMIQGLAVQRDQIAQLAERMLHVEESERKRMSHELHDETGQCLMSIRLELELLERSGARTPDEKAKLRELRQLTERTIIELRRIIAALSPALLQRFGLRAALHQLAARLRAQAGCDVRLHVTSVDKLPHQVAHVAYRILQECCNNIANHAGATEVVISVRASDARLSLTVRDNGAGFDVSEASQRHDAYGLAGIRERAAVLGGRSSITSIRAGNPAGKPSGTLLRIQLPLTNKREPA
jgi:signal transduction histidine kinase